MKTEDSVSSLATLAGQTIILGDIARSDIWRVMEMDISENSRALLKHAYESLGVLIDTAAQTQLPKDAEEMAA
jgi:hypothetical protein